MRDNGPCATNNDCRDDSVCDATLPPLRALPLRRARHRLHPRRAARGLRARGAVPLQRGARGDPYPEHLHVLTTPMVADLPIVPSLPDDPARPSIVAVFDDGMDGNCSSPRG